MVWERIQELKRQEARQEAERKAQEPARKAQEAADRLKRERGYAVEAQLKKEQERQKALDVQEAKLKPYKEIFERSGVLSDMREIEKAYMVTSANMQSY